MLLIVTEPFDPHVDFVEPVLDEQGTTWRRFHLSDFPTGVSAGYGLDERGIFGNLYLRGETIPLQQVHAVWYRRPNQMLFPPELSAADKQLVQRECNAFIQGLWRFLGHVTWVSSPDAIRLASSKAEQLVRARKLGFQVPRTCVSNNPDLIRTFLCSLGAGVEAIYKSHTPIFVDQPDRKKGVVYTTRLDEAALQRLDEIRLAPGIFQAYIPKRIELRVNVVGDAVFACSIDSQSVPDTVTDWRAHPWNDSAGMPAHEPFELPPEITDRCLRLVRSYGLNFGAIDLIVDPDGEYFFLELNPNGQWAWIQQATGQRIREELCRVLAQSRSRNHEP